MQQRTVNAECKFCTIAGREYLFKVLTLYGSLEKWSKSFHLWICCNDETVYSILKSMNLKNATPFPISELEDDKLLKIKYTRQVNEYCWTVKSCLIEYVLTNYKIDSLIYCDGDLFFFSDPKPIFDEWGDASIFLTHQRDLDWVHAKYGTYQAGLIGFKNDKNGLAALGWWRDRCIEWCYNDPQPELERWGDQKYLDKIPLFFQNVKISTNLGVNAAPWNSIYNNNYNIYEKENHVFIEQDKLICFHFACILMFNDSEFDLWTFMYIPMQEVIRNKAYIPYLGAIRKSIEKVKKYYDGDLSMFFSSESVSNAKTYFKYMESSEDNLVIEDKVEIEDELGEDKNKDEYVENDVEEEVDEDIEEDVDEDEEEKTDKKEVEDEKEDDEKEDVDAVKEKEVKDVKVEKEDLSKIKGKKLDKGHDIEVNTLDHSENRLYKKNMDDEKLLKNSVKRKYNFCSLVSMPYLIKELTLYSSLKKQLDDFHLWICCVDNTSYRALSKMQLKNVTVIYFKEIVDCNLLAIKRTRTLTEYCWTLKAPLILHLLKKYKLESIVYCDSDLYFFAHPKIIFDEWKGHSCFMCRQGGKYELERINGGFQAGLLGFSNDNSSLRILNWWKLKCSQWCFDKIDIKNERWGDQKYLDKVPHMFSSVKLIDNIGINAAPWNLIMNNNYDVVKINGDVFIESEKLIVYHFGSISIFNENEYDLWKLEPLNFRKDVVNYIYIPYIQDLQSNIEYLQSFGYRKSMIFCRERFYRPQNYFKY